MSEQPTRRLTRQVEASPYRRMRWSIVATTSLALSMLLAVLLFADGLPDAPEEGIAAPIPAMEAAGSVDDAADDADTDPEATAEIASLPLANVELFLARDPFEPVVIDEPVPDPEAPGTPGPGTGVAPGPADPPAPGGTTDPREPAGVAPTTGGTCATGAEVVCNGKVLSVVEIVEENGELVAVLQVDAMRYRVTPGDDVADDFEVLTVSADEVRLQYGDRVVTVLVGDNALK